MKPRITNSPSELARISDSFDTIIHICSLAQDDRAKLDIDSLIASIFEKTVDTVIVSHSPNEPLAQPNAIQMLVEKGHIVCLYSRLGHKNNDLVNIEVYSPTSSESRSSIASCSSTAQATDIVLDAYNKLDNDKLYKAMKQLARHQVLAKHNSPCNSIDNS
jgi:hypothetical protein